MMTQDQGHAERLLQLGDRRRDGDWETMSSLEAAVMLPHSTAAAK